MCDPHHSPLPLYLLPTRAGTGPRSPCCSSGCHTTGGLQWGDCRSRRWAMSAQVHAGPGSKVSSAASLDRGRRHPRGQGTRGGTSPGTPEEAGMPCPAGAEGRDGCRERGRPADR